METTTIFELTAANETHLNTINRLLAQLSTKGHVLSMENLKSIAKSDTTHLFLASINGETAGMLTLCTYRSPSGAKAWIEDVVVDCQHRSKGIGRALVKHAIAYAGKIEGVTLMLTSRPTRTEANKLYASEGFERKATNVYKMNF